ncbi:MAG: cyclopropane-fatty-acyl-phospholipid synthase family protein [Steroidobacteraceae bacterium]
MISLIPTSLARRLLIARLKHLADGELLLQDTDGTLHTFGRRTARCELSIRIVITDARFYGSTLRGGTVGAGEAYMQGWWRCDDLTGLIRLMVVNQAVMGSLERGFAWLSRPTRALLHRLNRNSRAGSRRNIAAHYDLGNDFYQLMLDETLAYSCGIFETPTSSLADASRAKFDAICQALQLKADERLLEIGTGWGGLAIHAAQHYGCHVTTTTVSQRQYEYVRARIAELGLADRITLLLKDYRDLDGEYDKIVSVEMIEAVGANFLDTYFAQCSRLLKNSGAMLLQAITIRDQLYERALQSVDFIQRHIFPGSFIPSITAMSQSLLRATDLKIARLNDIGPHYARTLAEWRRNVMDKLDRVRALGYPDSFIRMWEFYLCYCEGGFAERQLGDVQMLLIKPEYPSGV